MAVLSGAFSQAVGDTEVVEPSGSRVNNDLAPANEPVAADQIDESDLVLEFTGEEEPVANDSVQVFGFWDLMRMVLVLAFVILLIYALYFFLKRGRKNSVEEGSFISLLSTQSLPAGRQLYIIDVAGRVYLLGAGDGSLSLITEIDDKPSIDALRLQASSQQLRARSFSQLMNDFFIKAQGSGKNRAIQEPTGGFDFLRQQRAKVKKL